MGKGEGAGNGADDEQLDDGDSEDELLDYDDIPEEYFEMTDEQKKKYRKMRNRIKQQRQAEFERRDNYHR